jgi:hypothetical protein
MTISDYFWVSVDVPRELLDIRAEEGADVGKIMP